MSTTLILTGQCARIVESWLDGTAEFASDRPFADALDMATHTDVAATPFAPRSVRLGLGAKFVPHTTGPELSGAELELQRKLKRTAAKSRSSSGTAPVKGQLGKFNRPPSDHDSGSEEDSRTSRFKHRRRSSK